jgi:pheromone shutdown-related protein TraB
VRGRLRRAAAPLAERHAEGNSSRIHRPDWRPDRGPALTPVLDVMPELDPVAENLPVAAQADDPLAGVVRLDHGDRTLYLVGTAHVSQRSIDEVSRVIDAVRPDTVCVELCDARFQALTQLNRWKKLDIFQVILQGKTLFLLANLAISAYQRRLGDQLGVKPGAELLAAIEKAQEVGAEVVLIDRDIHVTLKRTWANLPFFKKMQLIGAIVESLFTRGKGDAITAEDIEKLKEQAQLHEMMSEFAKAMPEVKVPLIDERDQYLMAGIEQAPGDKVVAVVGAGHVAGMKDWLGKEVDRAALERIPPKSRVWGWLKWLVPIIILAAFYVGFTRNEGRTFEQMLWAWILPNSLLAGLLTAVAGAKLISIGSAILASPITSLNPLLGAGLVVGLVEAWARKPTVHDAEEIPNDVKSLRGVYKNAFTRVLLVAVMATVGSALGGWIGLSWVVAIWAS